MEQICADMQQTAIHHLFSQLLPWGLVVTFVAMGVLAVYLLILRLLVHKKPVSYEIFGEQSQ